MDRLTRQALWNAACVVAGLKPGDAISLEDLIDGLRRPLPDTPPSDAEIYHAHRFHVLHGGIKNAETVVTYEEAANLAETTGAAIRQAASRGRVVKLGVFWNGRERSGITLRSLSEWRRWPLDKFNEAARQVAKWREAQ